MDLMTPDWVKDAIFYQIFPDRFARARDRFAKARDRFAQDETVGWGDYPARPGNLQPWGATPTAHGFQGGDLWGAAEKLDYLVDLGINAIYLNPIFASASNHRYHTYDYYQVDPILGGNIAFTHFLEAAHARNVRVILDGVFNHASRGFFQFHHLLECGPESPYLDWFKVNGWPLNAYTEGVSPNYEAWWNIPSLPKFNTDTPAVREFLWRVATYWLEQGIDGWRLDVPNEIDDDTFWQEFRRRCKAINPDAYIVGELWGEGQRWLQGDQFDAQMNYLFTRAAFGYFVGENIDQTDTIRSGYGFIRPLTGPQFAGELNHIHNELYHPEVVLAQMSMLGSHDTPRLLTVAREDRTAIRLMFLCQMTVAGAPNIYYGDEIGMPGHHDPDCRRAFPWQDEASWDKGLQAAVRNCIALRRDTPALRRGDFQILYAHEQVIVYQRRYQGQTAVVAFNNGPEATTFTCPEEFIGQLPVRFVMPETSELTGDLFAAGRKIRLDGRSGCVWVN